MDFRSDRVYGKFYGVYFLISFSRGLKSYIGFTVDPERRLKQHNAGFAHGGAHKTNNKGPWHMILVVHGFPSEPAALRFEWAWQNPTRSRRLSKVIDKTWHKKNVIEYLLDVLHLMLTAGPWNRLSLSIHWKDLDFLPEKFKRTAVLYKNDILEKYERNYRVVQPKRNIELNHSWVCHFCWKTEHSRYTTNMCYCLNSECKLFSHITCYGKYLCSDSDEIIPVSGICPLCEVEFTWSELVTSLKINIPNKILNPIV